jgi:phage gpG-like protein
MVGIEQMLRIVDQYRKKADKEISTAVLRSALRIETAAKRRIQRGPKTGDIYQKENPTRTHQASAPGEPPATDTGRLASSIGHTHDGRQAAVIARTDYAATLEFGGTQGGRQILPRPFMNPSLEEDRPIFMRELKEAIQ